MRTVCPLMIFLLFTLLYLMNKLKINLLVLLKEPSIEKSMGTNDRNVFFTLEKKLKKYHARGLFKLDVMR